MTDRHVGRARYEDVGQDYLEQRSLRKSATWVLLWALGVGAVISGDFFGWNAGLKAGGFWGMAIATGVMAGMYVCLVYSIAELSAALPHAGGFISFARNAYGPTGGFICGITQVIEYVIAPAAVAVAIGDYLKQVHPGVPAPVWWLLAYAIFVAINIRGVELTLKVTLAVTSLAIVVLVVFYVGAVVSGAFAWENLFTVEPIAGHTAKGLPLGGWGIFAAIPFAIWFYLAIEDLPLAAEETCDVKKDMPRALTFAMLTLIVLSVLTLVLNSGVGGGAAAVGASTAPLVLGIQAVFGNGLITRLLTYAALVGLIASFHSIVYAYARVLFSLSRAGYIPRWISVTSRYHTPYRALFLGAVVGLACAFTMDYYSQTKTVTEILVNMVVFAAVISYVMVMISYIKLRLSRPDLPRPYRSPLGIPGAAVGTALSLLALAACFADPEIRMGVLGVAVFIVVAMTYFLAYSRHHLIAQAPEEEVALLAEAEKELEGS